MFCFLISLLTTVAHGYRILVLNPFPGPSHHVFISKFVDELVSRGHEIVTINNYDMGKRSNITQLLIHPMYDLSVHSKQITYGASILIDFDKNYNFFFSVQLDGETMFDKTEFNDFEYIYRMYAMGLNSAKYCLEHSIISDFIENDHSHFDLILAEQFYQESLLMFAHKYKAPVVTISKLFLDRNGEVKYLRP